MLSLFTKMAFRVDVDNHGHILLALQCMLEQLCKLWIPERNQLILIVYLVFSRMKSLKHSLQFVLKIHDDSRQWWSLLDIESFCTVTVVKLLQVRWTVLYISWSEILLHTRTCQSYTGCLKKKYTTFKWSKYFIISVTK